MIELTCPVCHAEFFTPDADDTDDVQGLRVRCPECHTKSQMIGSSLIPFARFDLTQTIRLDLIAC